MTDVAIYHNPECGTSRNTLALLRNAGIEPMVVEYLRTPPSRSELTKMIADAGLSVREALREKGTPFQELGLANTALTEDQLLEAMMAHPILINRPFVITPLGTRRWLTRDVAGYLTDRYSERKESAAKLEARVNLGAI